MLMWLCRSLTPLPPSAISPAFLYSGPAHSGVSTAPVSTVRLRSCDPLGMMQNAPEHDAAGIFAGVVGEGERCVKWCDWVSVRYMKGRYGALGILLLGLLVTAGGISSTPQETCSMHLAIYFPRTLPLNCLLGHHTYTALLFLKVFTTDYIPSHL